MRDNCNLLNRFSENIKQLYSGKHGRMFRTATYVGVFVVAMTLVGASYKSSSQILSGPLSATATIGINSMQGQNSNVVSVVGAQPSTKASTASTTTVADVRSANLATSVASVAGLSSANSVSSNAESANITAELAQSDTTSATKSQITEPTATTKAIDTYKAQPGDTVQTVADKYGISTDTLRFANNLTSDAINPDSDITIPATNGVVYTVKDGDSLDTIANKYHASVDDIISINNLPSASVSTGMRLLLPDGVLPENEHPGYIDPKANSNSNSMSTKPISIRRGNIGVPTAGDNRYAYGYCTWYAFNRRVQLGLPIANRWGNANTWDTSAAAAGLIVNRTPSVGAVFQTDAGYYGHVGIVERVNPDGSIFVSEMNYKGWGVRSTRTISNLSGYKFIH